MASSIRCKVLRHSQPWQRHEVPRRREVVLQHSPPGAAEQLHHSPPRESEAEGGRHPTSFAIICNRLCKVSLHPESPLGEIVLECYNCGGNLIERR